MIRSVPPFEHRLYIESYGVTICVTVNDPAAALEIEHDLDDILPGCHRVVPAANTEHEFSLEKHSRGVESLFRGTKLVSSRVDSVMARDRLAALMRLTVAEFARDQLFVHAGVVAWKDTVILIPAKSRSGKSTLVAEFVRRGALYFSDEYAVLDSSGQVHPFAKRISLRLDRIGSQADFAVGSFGGRAASDPRPVDIVLCTAYKPDALWSPRYMSRGEGVLELLQNTVAVRHDPNFALAILKRLADSADFVSTFRAGARSAIEHVIELCEANSRKMGRPLS